MFFGQAGSATPSLHYKIVTYAYVWYPLYLVKGH